LGVPPHSHSVEGWLRECRVQIIDHSPSKRHLFYRDFRVVGLLFSQPVFWGRGLLHYYSGSPVWAELPCPLWGGWAQWKLFWGGFCSLVAFHISFESQHRRDHFQLSASEQRDHSLFFSELSRTHYIRFCAAKKCCVLGCVPLSSTPSPCLPVSTFLCLYVSKTTTCPQFTRMSPPLQVSVQVTALKSFPHCYWSASLCPVSGVGGFCAPAVQDPKGSLPLPFFFWYLPVESWLPASYLKTSCLQYSICRDPDLSSYISGWFCGCSEWSGRYPAQFWGLFGIGSPTPPPSFPPISRPGFLRERCIWWFWHHESQARKWIA